MMKNNTRFLDDIKKIRKTSANIDRLIKELEAITKQNNLKTKNS